MTLKPIRDQSPTSRGSADRSQRNLVGDWSAINRRLVGDNLATYATSSRLNSVVASLLCMFKRQLATDFNRRLVGDFKKTFLRPLRPLRDFSFFSSRKPVANRLQSRCKHALKYWTLFALVFILQKSHRTRYRSSHTISVERRLVQIESRILQNTVE